MESYIIFKYFKIVQICRKHIEVQIKKQIISHQQAQKRGNTGHQLNIDRQYQVLVVGGCQFRVKLQSNK